METLKNMLPIIGRFLTWVTPKRLVMLSLFFLVLIASLTLFEQRKLLLDAISATGKMHVPAPPKIRVPDSLKTSINDYVVNNKKIVFISVVSSNIRFNQSEIVYFFTDDGLLRELELESRKNSGYIFPIFTSSATENDQMVAAINGQFLCYKYEDTFKNRSTPLGADISPFICNISLPPYYGKFSGYMLIGLKSKPSLIEMDELRLAGTIISSEIYTKNFRPKLTQ